MNEHGRDPQRENRRAGDHLPGAGGPHRSADTSDFVLGADGLPLLDRYGRPVRRRARPQQNQQPSRPAPQQPHRQAFPETRFEPRAEAPRRPQPQAPRPASSQQQGRRFPAEPPRQRQGRFGAGAFADVRPATPAPARPRRRRARRISPARLVVRWVAVILAAIVVFTAGLALWADTQLSRTDALAYEQVGNTPGTNWLLVGSDSRVGMTEEEQMELGTGGDVGEGRTDTIMLLHIPRTGQAQLVSIPRDSYVNIPGFGMDKINAAFTYGGPQLLGQTIEQWSGLHIDHYAEIGMGGLANVVNAVGGVEICVAEPIDDPLAGINLQAGCQNLQGRDALGYVRTRATAMGDLDRVQRQREFFAALLNKITSPATLLNPFRTVSLVGSTAKSFVVGEHDHVWNLARVAWAMGSGVNTQTVPLSGFADTAVGSVVLWDDAETAALWESLGGQLGG